MKLTYTIYTSNKDKTEFDPDDILRNTDERDARYRLSQRIRLYFMKDKGQGKGIEELTKEGSIYFYLFEGEDNISGKLIVRVLIDIHNPK